MNATRHLLTVAIFAGSLVCTNAAFADKIDDMADACETGIGQAAVDGCNYLIKRSQYLNNEQKAGLYTGRSVAYFSIGNFKEADHDSDHALTLAPDLPMALNNRCWLRAAMNANLESGLEDCNKALSAKSDADYFDTRGFLYFRMGKYEEATADLNKALAYQPKKAASLYVRGLTELKLGKLSEGQADIAAAKAIKVDIAERYAVFGIAP